MNLFIIFLISSFGVIALAMPQSLLGGGSAGGLLKGEGHHIIHSTIFGLSRGEESHQEEGKSGVSEGDHYRGLSGGSEGSYYGGLSGGSEGGHYGGLSGGSADAQHGGLSGGFGGLSGGYGKESSGELGGSLGGGYGNHEESLGFTGSHFSTPVDVHHEKTIHLKAHPEYHYAYHVADHKHKDYKSQHEIRDGYKVKGSYSLLEPDHKTIRVVDYVSDKKHGFIAKVTYKKHI